MGPERVTDIVWVAFLASWIAAAFWADRAERRPRLREEWLYRVITLAGAVLLFVRPGQSLRGGFRLWSFGRAGDWALFAVVVLGVAFTWWARLYLGRLWSSSVTKKAGHRVVDTGPYAIVRHPIYAGLLIALAATAGERGTPLAVAGAAALAAGFWIKARLEERFLTAELGAEAYDAYRRRVPMLLPFGPRG